MTHFRSIHQRCSVKKGILRNFAKFTGKHLCQSLFFNKVAGEASFLQNTSGRLLLKIVFEDPNNYENQKKRNRNN